MAKIGTVEGDGGAAGVGHNSGNIDAHPDVLNQTAQGQIKSIVERIERLNQEKAAIAEQIKEVKAEAKGNGFDVQIINLLLKRRAMDKAKGRERQELLELYAAAIGDITLAELA